MPRDYSRICARGLNRESRPHSESGLPSQMLAFRRLSPFIYRRVPVTLRRDLSKAVMSSLVGERPRAATVHIRSYVDCSKVPFARTRYWRCDRMKADAEPDERSLGKTAWALFLVCVIAFVATWLLNKSIFEARRDYKPLESHAADVRHMLGKMRAFRTHSNALYEAMLYSALRNNEWWRDDFAELTTVSIDGQHANSSLRPVFGEEKGYDSSVVRINRLNKAIQIMMQQMPSGPDRVAVVKQLIYRTLPPVRAIIVPKDIASSFDELDAPDSWDGVARWIVFGFWPPRQHGSLSNIPGQISFLRRYPFGWRKDDETHYFYDNLLLKGAVDGEVFLANEWEQASNRLRRSNQTPTLLNIRGTGFALNVIDCLLVLAPLIVVLEGCYFVFRTRNARANTRRIFAFPQFECPNDPLSAPFPIDIYQVVQRIIWSSFLVLPVTLLCIAFFFRYDFANTFAFAGNKSFLLTALEGRHTETPSLGIDFVNLLCLSIALGLLYLFTVDEQVLRRRREEKRVRASVCWLLPCLLVLVPIIAEVNLVAQHPFFAGMATWMYQAGEIIIALVLFFALKHRARLLMVTCSALLGFLTLMCLWVPHVTWSR